MIKAFDENLSKMLSVNFDIYSVRDYNDIAFDMANNMSLISQITLLAYNEPERFKALKSFVEDNASSGASDQFLLCMAYCCYSERKFDEGIDHIYRLLEHRPSDFDSWLDLCFFMAHMPQGYQTYLNMRFHQPYFMHYYHQYDFREINKASIDILDRLTRQGARDPKIRSGYDKKVSLDTEYLILNGACNNNCETCHTPAHLKGYDFEDRITKPGMLPLSDYIFIKARRKSIKHFFIKGGEPTLHPNYMKIIRMLSAVRRDMTVHVCTNARTFCNEKFLNKHIEAKLPNTVFETSLFSQDPEIHDAITRVRGSHEQTLQGMTNMLRAGLKVTARITLCDRNIDGLAGTIGFILEQFGAMPGFGDIAILLPPPSGNSLEKYYPDAVRLLHDRAAAVISGYEAQQCRITMQNAALASC